MTEQQRAELRELNAQIAAAGAADRAVLAGQRARLLSQTDRDVREIARDCDLYIRERYQNEQWKDQPAWKIRAELLGSARKFWKQAHVKPATNAAQARRFEAEARHQKAFATAALAYIAEISPELRAWRARPDFDALAALENADKNAEMDENAALEALQVAALALHFTRGTQAAARVYQRVLERQIAAGRYSAAHTSHVRHARCLQCEPYRQLAWWNLVVDGAPDEAQWRDKRARCLDRQCGDFRAARQDYEGASALAPADARSYEALAKIYTNEEWWDLAPDSNSDAATYLRALRLRIARGQIGASAAQLQAQGDQQMRQISKHNSVAPDYRYARAYAFYHLALAADPTDAALYLKCARTVSASPLSGLMQFGQGQPKTARVAFDYLARALAIDETIEAARAGVTTFLTRELQRASNHERLEALLKARQQLRVFGWNETLIDAIIAEVVGALAL